MFGLTRREQRWKAEQQAAELLVGLASIAIQAAATVNLAELQRLRAENDELKRANAIVAPQQSKEPTP